MSKHRQVKSPQQLLDEAMEREKIEDANPWGKRRLLLLEKMDEPLRRFMMKLRVMCHETKKLTKSILESVL